MASAITKVCRDCHTAKPLDQFGNTNAKLRAAQKNPGRFGGLYLRSYCKPCGRTRSAQFRNAKGADWMKDYMLRKDFGITLEQFQAMWDEQSGLCAVCNVPMERGTVKDTRGQTCCVDHDHDTGSVRGLLCFNCNTGLGKFGDDADLLLRAARYLISKEGD